MKNKSQDDKYILKLSSSFNKQFIYFFGVRHTNDPNDEQFIDIKKLFEEFLDLVKGSSIIFIEGMTREIPQKYEEAINMYGESGAVNWLGKKAGIKVVCPEPNEIEQRNLLCIAFDPHIVAYTVIVQNLAGWFRHRSQTSFDEAINRVLNREATFFNIYGFTPDKSWFDEQHKKLFGEQKLEDKQFLDLISDPRKDNTLVNRVVAYRSSMRNEYILSKITKVWQTGGSIFIVYGRGHFTSLKSSLITLVYKN